MTIAEFGNFSGAALMARVAAELASEPRNESAAR
jgi:hypothetical protein